MSTNKNKNYDSHFQDEWLSDEKYKYWINKDKNDPTKAYCTLCFKSISIARKGKGNLDEHANGKKHISKVPCSKQTLLALTAKQEKQAVVTTSSDKSQNQLESHKPRKQSSVNSYILNEAVTDAEIFWIIEVVLKKYSLNSCDGKKELFQAMFKDSEIAKKFTCGSTKCSYVINFGIAPYFRNLLENALNLAPFYVACFDESHNDVLKKGQMDMLLRFWNEDTNMVATRYYNSEFLGKAAAVDVHQKFKSCLSSLDSNKMIQVCIRSGMYVWYSFVNNVYCLFWVLCIKNQYIW